MKTSRPRDGNKRNPLGKKIRRGIAALVVAAALATYLFHYFWLEMPMGSGPAGPAVDREAFATPWSDRPVLLLGLGDSVTAGYGASPGLSYFDRLAANPPGEFPEMQGICLRAVLPSLRAENRSISGSTSLEHWDRQVRKLPEYPRDTWGVVVLTTGGNDIIHDYGRSAPREGAMFGASIAQAKPWIANFESRLERMLERIGQSFPGGCDIFLANIYDPTDGVGVAGTVGLPAWKDGMAIHREYNEVILRVAERSEWVHLVDIHGPMLGHGIHSRQFWRKHYHPQDPHYWFYDNFEDPNDRGYDAIRRLFLNGMAEVLPKSLNGGMARAPAENDRTGPHRAAGSPARDASWNSRSPRVRAAAHTGS